MKSRFLGLVIVFSTIPFAEIRGQRVPQAGDFWKDVPENMELVQSLLRNEGLEMPDSVSLAALIFETKDCDYETLSDPSHSHYLHIDACWSANQYFRTRFIHVHKNIRRIALIVYTDKSWVDVCGVILNEGLLNKEKENRLEYQTRQSCDSNPEWKILADLAFVGTLRRLTAMFGG